MSSRRRAIAWAATAALLAGLAAAVPSNPVAAGTPPAGFQEQVVFSGLNRPTNIEFAPDGRIFVAEQRGVIKVYDNLADTTPTIFADLSANVHNQWDRGLLGLALAPNFPADPWVYVLYTYDAPPGQTAPVWNDVCPDANNGQCVVTARLSRLQAAGNVMTGTEQVLLSGWCQQYPSHSIGDLHFGADGALYVSAGDGASFSAVDYGQLGNPANPCGDPTSEGGALRSQDIRSTDDPTGLSGSILRLNPTTGAAAAGNPNLSASDVNTQRIVAHGLRNPFRFTVKPGTNEVWTGDVGWNDWEEINRIPNPTAAPVANFGWPCFEGVARNAAYDGANLNLCKSLYTAATQTSPYYSWSHSNKVVAGESCPTGSSSSTGVAFYPTSGGSYPTAYDGALFFADYSRGCIWAMKTATPGGQPSTSNIETFVSGAASPVDLAVGPGDELYYVDMGGGTVRRIRHFAGNEPPVAVATASPTTGAAPLAVNFNGSGSTDADPADQGRLTYAWDFTNDGTTDSTLANPIFTYTTNGSFTAKLTVTDTLGATNSKTITITPGNESPVAIIDTPVATTTWSVGQTITFTGHGTDPQQGNLPASALTWHLRMQHCETVSSCHSHYLQDWTGVSGGSFIAPDHEYPSYLELELVATDSQGLTHTVVRRLDPKTVNLTFNSNPTGLILSVGAFSGTAPFTRTVIQNSSTTITAPGPQVANSNGYSFGTWSDGGAQTHVITAPATAATYTATFTTTTLTNLALNKPATADSQCNANEAPAKAFNGSVTGGNSDKWCSTGEGWLRVDLGSISDIRGFVVRHAGAGGEQVEFNTRDFNIQVSTDGTTWTTVSTTAGNIANVTTHPVSVSGRYVKLNIATPTSNGNLAARIYELEVLGTAGTPPVDPPPTRTNLALNKAATASAQCASAEGPARAVNGTWNGGNSDKWCAPGATGWLRVDLGTVASIGDVVVHHAGDGGESTGYNTKNFAIQVSDDDATWTTVSTVTNNTANNTTNTLNVSGRYVRLNVTASGTSTADPAVRVYELEVFGTDGTTSPPPPPPPPPPPTATNLALNKAATADGQCSSSETPAKAVNGSVTGGNSDKWCSGPTSWLRVDLGAVATINSFVVRHAGAGGEAAGYNTRDFNLQVSNDGTTWTTVATVTGNTANVTTNTVAVTGRYVRLNIVTAQTSTAYPATRIYELEVIGTIP
jgi:glucose/arabinose dehydrogenase